MTRDLAQHPAVPGAVNVGRRGGLTEIAGRNAIGLDHCLLDQRCVGERQRGCKQRALDVLPAPGFAALNQSGVRPERAVKRGYEITTVYRGPVWRISGSAN